MRKLEHFILWLTGCLGIDFYIKIQIYREYSDPSILLKRCNVSASDKLSMFISERNIMARVYLNTVLLLVVLPWPPLSIWSGDSFLPSVVFIDWIDSIFNVEKFAHLLSFSFAVSPPFSHCVINGWTRLEWELLRTRRKWLTEGLCLG